MLSCTKCCMALILCSCQSVSYLQSPLYGHLACSKPSMPTFFPKLLFILGQFCRYGSHILDASAEREAAQEGGEAAAAAGQGAKRVPDCRRCLELFVRVWNCPTA